MCTCKCNCSKLVKAKQEGKSLTLYRKKRLKNHFCNWLVLEIYSDEAKTDLLVKEIYRHGSLLTRYHPKIFPYAQKLNAYLMYQRKIGGIQKKNNRTNEVMRRIKVYRQFFEGIPAGAKIK